MWTVSSARDTKHTDTRNGSRTSGHERHDDHRSSTNSSSSGGSGGGDKCNKNKNKNKDWK